MDFTSSIGRPKTGPIGATLAGLGEAPGGGEGGAVLGGVVEGASVRTLVGLAPSVFSSLLVEASWAPPLEQQLPIVEGKQIMSGGNGGAGDGLRREFLNLFDGGKER
jgi:hypothetical protein